MQVTESHADETTEGVCPLCKKPFRVGERIVTTYPGSPIYHESCYWNSEWKRQARWGEGPYR